MEESTTKVVKCGKCHKFFGWTKIDPKCRFCHAVYGEVEKETEEEEIKEEAEEESKETKETKKSHKKPFKMW
jgi:hypothetical protein